VNVSKETILGALPPFKDQWILLHPDQTVKDIIIEVLNGHEDFSDDYDRIALFFDGNSIEKTCTSLFDFCKQNLPYIEENEEEQTVASPSALLTRGHCDCKGYANFSGGILSALNRQGKKIKWNYVFASYDLLRKSPHHVFINVIDDDGNEIWIDPTPDSEKKEPVWRVDKKINDMALYKISGFEEDQQRQSAAIGVVVAPNVDVNNINYDGSNKYANVFGHHLGLSGYAEYENDSGTNWTDVANQINTMIAKGPHPGHTVTSDFVKWVFDNNIRFWNFYYPAGVVPGFADSINQLLPASWPRPVVTQDGRLTFDRDAMLEDYRNAEIHVLNAALQDLINRYDPAPYPLKPRDVKLFSQEHTGNPNDTTANLFTERRGESDLKKAIDTVSVVVLPIIQAAAGYLGIKLDLTGVEDFVASNYDKVDLLDQAFAKYFPDKNVSYSNGNLNIDGSNIPVEQHTVLDDIKKFLSTPTGIIVVVGVGALLLMPKNKRRVTGVKTNWIVPVGLGVGLIWFIKSRDSFKNIMQETNPIPYALPGPGPESQLQIAYPTDQQPSPGLEVVSEPVQIDENIYDAGYLVKPVFDPIYDYNLKEDFFTTAQTM